MESKGYIKLHRSILDWEWYGDTTTTSVFIHLLLTANWEETRWRGQTIKRGETKTTYKDIAKALGISIQSTRTAISHLESTGEITRRVTNHRQFITIENYEKYQGCDLPTNTQTNTQDTDNLTSDQQATNTHNIKEYKEIKEVKKTNNIKRFVPPSVEEVRAYCLERGNHIDPQHFIDYYQSNGWKVGKNPMKDWRASVRNWEKNQPKPKSNNPFLDMLGRSEIIDI